MYGAITRYRPTFQKVPLILYLSAAPLSLAATKGISVDFFSSGYLDGSVHRVRFVHLCIQCTMTQRAGFPHSEISGYKCLFVSSPELIADYNVLHRL